MGFLKSKIPLVWIYDLLCDHTYILVKFYT